MKKQSFIKGTMILMAAGIINRILGFVPRITLPRIIGAEGVGLYQLGYPFLTVILTVITGGIPLAVAKLTAEAESEGNEAAVRRILIAALTVSISLGILFTILCVAAAPWITNTLLTDSRVNYTFYCMSPMIVIVAVSSVFRGYFQGRQNMIPTAVSQTVETIIRIIAVLGFASLMMPYGIAYAAAGAMAGVVVGEVGGMLVLVLQYMRHRQSQTPERGGEKHSRASRPVAFKKRPRSTLRKLLKIAVPVTASRMVGSFSYFFESIIIAQSLSLAGFAASVATAQYGAMQGMVVPILLLPTALTFSLSVSLVPSLSEAAARNDLRTIHMRLHQSLRLALVTGAPFAVLMYVLANPLCTLLYNDSDIGTMLKMMAPVACFLYFQPPLQAALQALEKPGTALINSFIGSVVKLFLIYELASNPKLGIAGAIIAMNVNIVLVALLHWRSVVKLLGFSMNLSEFLKVGLAMVGMGFVVHHTMYQLWVDSMLIRFTAACTAGMGIYLLATVWLGLIDKEDLVRIPWIGRKLPKWL